MFLVTGATGNVGRIVVERLLARGEKVRALVRDPQRADLPEGVEVAEGDLSRPDTLAAALDGVTGAFLYAVPGSGPAFAQAAGRAGVERVVLLSSNGVDDTATEQANPIAAYHAEIEQALRAAEPAWTFLRSAHMATNALPWAGQIRAGDVVRAPYAGATSAPVHEADLAEVAVVALTQDGHAGQVYPLSGPQSLTAAEQVALIGQALGRPLAYHELTPEVAREQMSRFMPPFVLDTLFEQWEQSVGHPAPVYDTVERLTGRPARTFAQWAADRAADFS
ncbi:NAD(P)H-binding protein [Nonomuraea sp. NPDC005501]|uniref:NAD(P)H-binding protein n=1 Tax=Nonomuraea sp. NPDC005501 TaxID=3156884 RepID=UPI00339E3966